MSEMFPALATLRRWGRHGSPIDAVLAPSMVLMVVNAREIPLLFVAMAAVAVVTLATPLLLRHPAVWLGSGLVAIVAHALEWHGVDDHVVATSYWALALGLVLWRGDDDDLAHNARMLAGLIFGFAAFWKLTSGQFLSGELFEYSLLVDDRFRWVAEHVGGLPSGAWATNEAAVAAMHVDVAPAALVTGPRIEVLAAAMTWWGVVTEVSAAVVLLAPLPERWRWTRHVAIAAFCATTYVVLPVGGFALLLLVLGLAQTTPGSGLRRAYPVAMAAVLVWGPTWLVLFG